MRQFNLTIKKSTKRKRRVTPKTRRENIAVKRGGKAMRNDEIVQIRIEIAAVNTKIINIRRIRSTRRIRRETSLVINLATQECIIRMI